MSAQTRMIAGVGALVAVMAGFWFLLLAPKRADISAANGKIAQAETRRDAAQASASEAGAAKSRYMRDYETVARLGKAVPADDDVASLVYQLEAIARANKIDFRAVKLTAPATAPAEPQTAAAAAAETSDKKAEAGKDPTAATTAVAPVVAQPPPGAVVGPAGLLTVPFTLQFDGGYMEVQRLLKAINGLAKSDRDRISVRGRLLTIDGFALQPGSQGFPQLKAVISATAYIVPETDDATAGATAQGPAGATAGAPTTTALINPDAQGAGR